MPALKEGEKWNPRYGVGDVQVIGGGVADFSNSYHNSYYMDLSLCFLMENLSLYASEKEPDKPTKGFTANDVKEAKFAELEFTTNAGSLVHEKGYSEEDAKEISDAVTVLCKYINKAIFGSNPEYERVEKWTGGPLLSQDGENIIIHRKDE